MPKIQMGAPVRVPIHIIQRGDYHQVCFGPEEDLMAFTGWLKGYPTKYNVDVHAWVLISSYVHLLCTPRQNGGISEMMQSLGRKYVRIFNYQNRRIGTLWYGCYKSVWFKLNDIYFKFTAISNSTRSERIWWMILLIRSGQVIRSMRCIGKRV